MIKFTRSPLLALAALVAASAAVPAMASDVLSGGIPLGITSNTLSANNIAAGQGNTAVQNIQSMQMGGGQMGGGQFGGQFGGGQLGFGGFKPTLPSVTNNTTVGTNVAAGIGNGAFQTLGVGQSGGHGLVNNGVDALNLAAGSFNQAGQNIQALQHK